MLLRRCVLVLVRLAVTPLPGASPGGASTVADVTLTGFSPAQSAQIRWAVDLFDRAGLALPPVELVHSASTEPCRGRAGLHRRIGEGSTIWICTDDAGPAEEFLYLHELAHAWDRAALTEQRRAGFLELRGLDAWQGTDPERWNDYGAEQAAEIVVWALIDRPIWPVRVRYQSCADLAAAYGQLTGRPPLHGYSDYCDPDGVTTSATTA